jgi:hypothetical protein
MVDVNATSAAAGTQAVRGGDRFDPPGSLERAKVVAGVSGERNPYCNDPTQSLACQCA